MSILIENAIIEIMKTGSNNLWISIGDQRIASPGELSGKKLDLRNIQKLARKIQHVFEGHFDEQENADRNFETQNKR